MARLELYIFIKWKLNPILCKQIADTMIFLRALEENTEVPSRVK